MWAQTSPAAALVDAGRRTSREPGGVAPGLVPGLDPVPFATSDLTQGHPPGRDAPHPLPDVLAQRRGPAPRARDRDQPRDDTLPVDLALPETRCQTGYRCECLAGPVVLLSASGQAILSTGLDSRSRLDAVRCSDNARLDQSAGGDAAGVAAQDQPAMMPSTGSHGGGARTVGLASRPRPRR